MMTEVASALLDGDNMRLRSALQDMLQEYPVVGLWTEPISHDPRMLAAAASVAELIAERLGQIAPHWTCNACPLPQPMFVVKSAATMKRLRHLCETESPYPLRKRGFYAPPGFLDFA